MKFSSPSVTLFLTPMPLCERCTSLSLLRRRTNNQQMHIAILRITIRLRTLPVICLVHRSSPNLMRTMVHRFRFVTGLLGEHRPRRWEGKNLEVLLKWNSSRISHPASLLLDQFTTRTRRVNVPSHFAMTILILHYSDTFFATSL